MLRTQRGGMPNQRARKSQRSQIGQLDTTPTSRHLQSPQVDNNPVPPSAQQPESTNEYHGDVDDEDFAALSEKVPGAFWSEGASTRRSTPIDSPCDGSSSQESGSGKLPSTQPLPSQLTSGHLINNGRPLVDFSETATTARRSSPYPQTTLSQVASDMRVELPEYNTVPELPGTIPDSYEIPMDHLPADELYDATPVPEDREEDITKGKQHTAELKSSQKSGEKSKTTDSSKKVKASLQVLQDEVGSVKEEPSSFPPEQPVMGRRNPARNAKQVRESPEPAPGSAESKTSVTRRGKQRAKPPYRFDSKDQIIEPPPAQAKPVRTSMVENMIQAHAASISPDKSAKKPTPKSRKKFSPKTALNTTPKAVQKAPVVSQRTTRQSVLRGQHNQQSPDKANEGNSVVSPAGPPVESKPKLPAVNQRATRKAKEEPVPVPPSKGQERTNYGNDTQGSTDDPIILSSGRNSSSPCDDDEFVPPTDLTEFSPEELTRPDTVPRVEKQSLVDPGEPLDIARNPQEQIVAAISEIPKPVHPTRRTERQVTAQKKTITVKAEPKNPVEAGLKRTNREQPIRIGPREVLSARDANALAQRHTSKVNTLKRPPSTKDPVVDTSVPPRKVMKRTRSFNVSQVSSPLPVETAAVQLPEGTSSSNRDDDEDPTVSHSNKQAPKDYLSSLAVAESKPKNRVKENLQQERVGDRRWRSEVSATNQDLHAQIFNSLQVRDEPPKVHDEGNDDSPEQEELGESTRPKGPSDELEEKLNGLVKTLVGHLQTKEATIYRGADAYRKNGIGSVEKIKRRYTNERQQLKEIWKTDTERFVRGSRSITATVDKRGKSRQEAGHKLEETLARRRHLFERATTSLRDLHGRLMERRYEENED
ncbi:unnamed protein product [Fusarium venenatum]|uniref:Uncharacterized protein n=1 Tax=Fusarium venenatum TaxID=56646 RepID=A0A2L2U0E5_9HYPO|nr:uncharacterized protein FVRRES_08457 [Fusarium venenatum]CEI68380.1 unnamed protein product [Fusarium venenatum]